MSKPKLKIKINNKIPEYGTYDNETGVLEVNKKKHKNKRELADTVAHELTHRKHPNMKEKTVQKINAPEISVSKQNKLVAKLRNKSINNKMGAIKRHFKIKGKTEPGELISRMNQGRINSPNNPLSKRNVAILGMI